MPQNSVYSIVQTADGYIWLTTLDGLVRFDGVRFKIFNKSNTKNLPTNRFAKLFAETDNTLWICTEGSAVVRYRNGEFKTFTILDGLASNRVLEIQKDTDGSLLFFAENEIIRFRDDRFSLEAQRNFRDYRIYIAPSGTTWELTKNGLKAKRLDGQETFYDLPFDPRKLSPDPKFERFFYVQMYEDSEQTLWMSATGNLYKLKAGAIEVFTEKDGMPQSLVRVVAKDKQGNIWLGTERDGVCRLNQSIACMGTEHGLSSNNVWDMFFDREETLWITTYEKGFNRLTKQVVRPLSTAEGLANKNIYPILEDSRGNVWIGAFNGLAKYSGGEITNYKRGKFLQYEIVQSLFEDRDGTIWVGSLGGVMRLNENGAVDFTEKLGLEIGTHDFWDIHQTPDGAMWFANNKGVIRYYNNTSKLFTIADGLPDNDVKIIHEARDGSLWFGTINGAARFTDNRFTTFTERDGLAGNYIRSIYEDETGALWFGTYDSGLSRFKNGKFDKITVQNGLFSDGVFQILLDPMGNFWMSSNQGIYRVAKQQLDDFADGKIQSIVSTAFDKSDGMLNTECNGGRQPAGIKASDGRLWFPTQDGVAIVDPEAVEFNRFAPPLVIEEVRIENQPLADFPDLIELQPGQENLEIDYTGLSFIKPEQVRFRYQLEGFDNAWTDAGGRRTAYFSYLPPGEYTFRVTAANKDGVWNDRGAAIKIAVLPPFYRASWFVLLTFLTVFAAVYFAYRYRIERLHKKAEQQEMFSRQMIQSQENERKRIAVGLHDSLGQQLLVIKNWAMLELAARQPSNSTREALNEITAAASEAIEEVREIIYDLRPYQLDKIGLRKTLLFMIEKVGTSSNIRFTTEIDDIDDLFNDDSEIVFYRIVQECLNNIVKHSKANEATVTIQRDGQNISLKIEDDGLGFNINSPGGESNSGGFGLTGISERVRMLGGNQIIESEPNRGTKIFILIPIEENK